MDDKFREFIEKDGRLREKIEKFGIEKVVQAVRKVQKRMIEDLKQIKLNESLKRRADIAQEGVDEINKKDSD